MISIASTGAAAAVRRRSASAGYSPEHVRQAPGGPAASGTGHALARPRAGRSPWNCNATQYPMADSGKGSSGRMPPNSMPVMGMAPGGLGQGGLAQQQKAPDTYDFAGVGMNQGAAGAAPAEVPIYQRASQQPQMSALGLPAGPPQFGGMQYPDASFQALMLPQLLQASAGFWADGYQAALAGGAGGAAR